MSMSTEVIRSMDQLRCADHISFPAQCCNGNCTCIHHALVVADNIGNGRVKIIHAAEKKGAGRTGCEIREDEMHARKHIDKGELKRYIYAPNQCGEPYEVIHKAREMKGNFDFNPFNNNCEYFVRSCKARSADDAAGDYRPRGGSSRNSVYNEEKCIIL